MKAMQASMAFAGGLLALAGLLSPPTDKDVTPVSDSRPPVVDPTPVSGAGAPQASGTEVTEKVDGAAAATELAAEPDVFSATKLWKLPDGTLVMGPEENDPDYNIWADLYVKPLLKKKNPVECEGGSCSKTPLKNEGVCKDGSCSKPSNAAPVQRLPSTSRRSFFRR
jgi:hypothetical protein